MAKREKFTKNPELGWSLYMSGGWQSQFERVKRWHKRIKEADNTYDKWDFIYTFYENAFHFRDWLIKTNFDKKDNILNFFYSNKYLRICGDLANSHKHYLIDSPSQPYPPTEFREYKQTNANFDKRSSLIVLSNGERIDAFLLADQIMQILEEYISRKAF